MFRGILESRDWRSVSPVKEGWSGDEKFRAVDGSGNPLLVRISSADRHERRSREFETLCSLNGLPVNISRALAYGPCEGGVYMLLTWVDGTSAEELLPSLSQSQQAALGLQAGKILRALHSLPAPDGTPDWQTRFAPKMARKVQQYASCPIKTPACDDFIHYIEQNSGLIAGRPNSFQHGDYHVGNMVVSDSMRLGVVDFDRMDWGDPWEEFNRITWSAQCSPVFASALVRGYFGGEAPDAFWQLMALYIASNQLSCIPWAIPFGQQEVDVMVRQCEEVRAWYGGGYGASIPSWYH